MKPATRELLTGLAVLSGGALLLGWYGLTVYRRFNSETVSYLLDAERVPGLTDGAVVEMGGYPVGSVDAVRVFTSPKLHFEVEVAVRRDIPLPVGTQATLVRLLAGGAVIELEPPEKPDGAIAPLAHLPLTPAPELQDLIERGDRILREAEVTLTQMQGLLTDPERGSLVTLDHALREFDGLMVDGRASVGQANAVVSQAAPGVRRSIASTETLLAGLNRSTAELDQLLALTEQRIAELDRVTAVADGYDPAKNAEVGATLHSLQQSAAALERWMAAFERRPIRTLRKGVPDEGRKEEDEPAGLGVGGQ